MPLILPDGFQYVTVSMVSAAWLILWQLTRIHSARQAAGIHCPQMYAENVQLKDNPAALRYNCIQRCHQNTLETIPLLFIGTFITGLNYPYLAATTSFIWVLTRVLYTINYSSGIPERRAAGAAGGFVTLIILLAAATVTTVQLCFY